MIWAVYQPNKEHIMNTIERKFKHKDVIVEHIFEPAKQDRQHLLVIFSGFSVDYEFRGATAEGCRSNILWIKDKFFGDYTYYLFCEKSHNIESAIIDLIDEYRLDLNLSKEQCTLMGFSKGGSAALYYALKYDFRNIIASCPQVKIGTYISTNWRRPTRHMLGEGYTELDITNLDGVIPNLLNSESVVNKNIYLISSPQDVQYKTEIEPYLDLFWRCKNFNFIFTKSTLAWQHNKVTRYNIPMILSIIHAHGEGVVPHFGQVSNGVNNYDIEKSKSVLFEQSSMKHVISMLHKVKFDEGRLYPDGAAFIKGMECESYRKIKQTLLLIGFETYEIPLGKVINEDLSYQYFDRVFCDYRAGGISSVGYKGIDLTNINVGTYKLGVKVESGGVVAVNDIDSKKDFNIQHLFDNRVYSIFKVGDKIHLNILSLTESTPIYHFQVNDKWVVGNVLHYEGAFVVKGKFVESWGDSTYYLTIKGENYKKVYKLGLCHFDELNDVFDDHKGIYQKSYFCSMGRKGITLEDDIPDGMYDIYISMVQKGVPYIYKTDDQICVLERKASLVNS